MSLTRSQITKNIMMDKLKSLCRFLSPKFQTLHLEYKVSAEPRYGHGKPAHSLLNEIIRNKVLKGTVVHSGCRYVKTRKKRLDSDMKSKNRIYY
jgi:hypothetical protein